MSDTPERLACNVTCPACGAMPFTKCTNPRHFPVSHHKARWEHAGIPKPTFQQIQENLKRRKAGRLM